MELKIHEPNGGTQVVLAGQVGDLITVAADDMKARGGSPSMVDYVLLSLSRPNPSGRVARVENREGEFIVEYRIGRAPWQSTSRSR